MAVVTMKSLLEAGVHFGHQTRRWNPKMASYIFTERNGIHIIDLQQTLTLVNEAYEAVRQVAADGGKVLFVGTKKQAQDAIASEAKRCNQYYVSQRWLGGMLTNFQTIEKSIKRLEALETMSEDGTYDLLPKKEVIQLEHEAERLERFLGGIKDMKGLPDIIFIVDPKKEYIAVNEAHKLNIPIVAIMDTNADPDEADYVIPGNDDAIRSVKLMTSIMANAVIEGRQGEQNEGAEDVAEAQVAEDIKEESEDTAETEEAVEEEHAAEIEEAEAEEARVEEKEADEE